MKSGMTWRMKAVLAAVLAAGLGAGMAQKNGGAASSGMDLDPQLGPANHRPPRLGDPGGEMAASTQERMNLARSNERQKLLVADTDKLLELATQLKADVGKTDKNMLSLDVVKRAEAIEKLARSVKDREKGVK